MGENPRNFEVEITGNYLQLLFCHPLAGVKVLQPHFKDNFGSRNIEAMSQDANHEQHELDDQMQKAMHPILLGGT